MNIHEMTIEQLMGIEVTSVEQGKQLAEDILQEQLALHREMVGLYDNARWEALSDRHYDLRKIRYTILHVTGNMTIDQKRVDKR